MESSSSVDTMGLALIVVSSLWIVRMAFHLNFPGVCSGEALAYESAAELCTLSDTLDTGRWGARARGPYWSAPQNHCVRDIPAIKLQNLRRGSNVTVHKAHEPYINSRSNA